MWPSRDGDVSAVEKRHQTQWNLIKTHTTVQQPFVRGYPGEPVPEETFTHSHPSTSSDILYQLPPSTTTMIHIILLVQFTCLAVLFNNLSPGPLWSSSWSGTLYFISHTSLHPIIIFLSRQTWFAKWEHCLHQNGFLVICIAYKNLSCNLLNLTYDMRLCQMEYVEYCFVVGYKTRWRREEKSP